MTLDALGRERELMHLIKIDFVELLTQNSDVLGMGTRQNHVDVGNLGNLIDDVLVMRRRHLRAVGPVGLVTVVLLGVVRRRHDHARMAFQLADGEAQLGRRTQCVEEEYGEAVRGEDVGHTLGEHARIVAAVVAHGHANLLAREILLQVVGQALRGGTHRVDIHAVRAHAHNAAQTARTEFQVLVEALHKFLHIVLHQVLDLLFGLFVIMTVEPRLRLAQYHLFQFVCHRFLSVLFIVQSAEPPKNLYANIGKIIRQFNISELKLTPAEGYFSYI